MPLAGRAFSGQHFAAMQHAETSRLRVVAAAATDARRDDGAEELAGSSAVDPIDGVPSPGRYIKEQRKRQGMSIDQLAAATKIPRTSLELLEADEHEGLPGPVFVKGFLRCCARALGLEPELVMELVYDRERELLVARRRERPAASAPEAAAVEPDAVVPTADAASGPAPAAKAETSEGMDLFGGLRRVVGNGGMSMMLWFVVALFVAMVMMAAFNMLGVGPTGPT